MNEEVEAMKDRIGRNLYLCTFKNGLCNPAKLAANDYEDARKRAYSHYLKNSGYVEMVNMKSTVDSVVKSVTQIDA